MPSADINPQLDEAITRHRAWMESRDFAGHEPYDVLNSPYFSGGWARRAPFGYLLIQSSKRWGGMSLRRALRIPASRNPKALALSIMAYCDLARCGEDTRARVDWLKRELIQLRDPNEDDFAWGYDWDFMSLRGTRMPAFRGNCIASVFGGMAMLDAAELFQDDEGRRVAASVARFLFTRLNRSFESATEICLSYTPADRTLIFNNSALAAAFLARVGTMDGRAEYLDLAAKAMRFLVNRQNADGGWPYGVLRKQQWIDSFHTSYNVLALRDYRKATGNHSFDDAISRGHAYYAKTFFLPGGTPKYFNNRIYPIDIHACSQATLHFCAFAEEDTDAPHRAEQSLKWTLAHMLGDDGAFFYQKRRITTDTTPYMRWGQAWMLHAMARLKRTRAKQTERTQCAA